MGEVDAVIPEKSDCPEQTTATATTIVNGEVNGVCKTDEVMDVDTEEDSQISSENGIATNETESEKIINKKNIVENNIECLSNSSSSSSSTNNDFSNSKQKSRTSPPKSSTTTIANDSENVTETSSSSSAVTDENSQNTAHSEENSRNEDNSSKENGSVQTRTVEKDEVEQSKIESKSTNSENKFPTKNEDSNNKNNDKIKENCSPSQKTNGDLKESQKQLDKETIASGSKNDKNDENDVKNQSSTEEGIVQSEKSDIKITKVEEAVTPMEIDSSSNTSKTAISGIVSNKKINEDDAAVVIPSDSESDNPDSGIDNDKSKVRSGVAKKQKQQEELKEKKDVKKEEKIVDDDVVEVLSDKDDCVVIEDDDKKENTIRRTPRQRKNVVKVRDFSAFEDDDIAEIVDDSKPPPSKRARTAEPQTIGQIGQITIKDARSLMSTSSPYQDNSSKQSFHQTFSQISGASKGTKEPTLVIIDTNTVMQKPGLSAQSAIQNLPVNSTKLNAPYSVMPVGGGMPGQQNVFPVNIRPALTAMSVTPPKLVPTSIPPPPPATTQNNPMQDSSILPNLTDDMFVLEAPSFIVPYIYEKPPSENLKEVVTKLSVEAQATEKEQKQKNDKDGNKEETSVDGTSDGNTESKKDKKKRKKPKNPDDSWGESDESTDDDASDAETRTKVLIKEVKNDITSIVTNTEALKQSILGADSDKKSENYFDSPLGKFFIDIGIGLVQEYVQADLLRQQKRKRDKARGSNTAEIERAINSLKQNLQTSRKRNEPFKFEMRRCEYCNFKSESALAMAHHYETPHMRQYMYKCNFCPFEVRPPHDILFHMEAVHNIKGRLEKAPSYHQCPNCPFEDNGKSKLARHVPVCAKKFRPEHNLLPPSDWEAPAKIPRIKPRHGLVGTATAYQAMAAQAAAQKAALASFSQRAVTPTNNANNAFMRNRGRPQGNAGRSPAPVIPTNARVRQVSPGGVVMPNIHMTGGQFIQVSGSNLAVLPNSHNTLALQQQQQQQQQNSKKSGGNGQPSISITPLPRQSNNQSTVGVMPNPLSIQPSAIPPLSTPKPTPTGLKPGQGPGGGGGGNKASFVICEICDGYIKDLEQLRNHMQWMHKVKIHPKMIYNRPPLNCQKCQFRFFTDQGLERHLLGSHGLVTSSMQEAANKGKDAGRCPVCGRMYQWKLLNHVSRDHHMTLKPAHLSYKCTVCTATFGMYKQFENHVYTAHSTVAKKAMDNKKNPGGNIGSNNLPSSSNSLSSGGPINQRGGNSSSSVSSLSLSGNDSLLKPLKINDEITIIPQPASKSRGSINEIESHVIGKSSSFSGTTSSGRSGVNLINNDEIEEISDDDEEEEDSDYIILPNGTKKKVWSLEETKYLIDSYKKFRHYLEKKSFKKDDLWYLINEDMKRAGFKNSSNQIKFKFDKLKRTYIKAKRRNRKTKYKPRAFRFMEDFDELFAQEEEKRMAEKAMKAQLLNVTL